MRSLTCSFLLLLVPQVALAHDGPDPIAHWQFNSTNIEGQKLKARLGPDATFSIKPRLVTDPMGQSVAFNGRNLHCQVAKDVKTVLDVLPKSAITVSAWVAIDQRLEYGSFACAIQDNGDEESGWVLGYDQQNFYFGLATEGADDGNGLMTYLKGKTHYELGKIYHVVAVYDGEEMQLYVNGKRDASSKKQSGPILYPDSAPFVLGCYQDDNEYFPLKGRIRDIAIYDMAAKDQWVAEEFQHLVDLTRMPAVPINNANRFVVKPYLQYGTLNGMTVAWRSSKPSFGTLHWGEDDTCQNQVEANEEKEIQQLRIEGLEPETQYFYWVESFDAQGSPIESEVATFQTASRPETPFAFAVISDTQHNPSVSGPIAELAWAHRPNFLLHAGDLVDQGKMSDDWIDEFFASMHPLISRVPMYPVLGNHEQNAKNYFDYMALPAPEYYYKFSYGNADFFMIDSNRKVAPGSEQYQWLAGELSKSTATWKFVCHHHPPYSSDENDYGNLWKTNKSTRGDTRVRQLVPLYEKFGVDIVWTGHIHSYERTWPIRENRATDSGTMYMITGGGGGGLETPGPYRPFFQNNVRRGHHYVMVMINGPRLELKAFDFDDQMFDSVSITQPGRTGSTTLDPLNISAGTDRCR